MITTYIYTLSDSEGIKYIGKSDSPYDRLKTHLKDCKKKKTIKEKWIYSILQKNEYPILEILDEVPFDLWSFYESYWIQQIKSWGFNLVNGTEGGEGSNGFKGKKHSLDTIEKCRNSAKLRESKTCLKGSSNGMSKLDDDKVIIIKKMLEEKISYNKIAKEFKVAKITILNIASGKKWKHVK